LAQTRDEVWEYRAKRKSISDELVQLNTKLSVLDAIVKNDLAHLKELQELRARHTAIMNQLAVRQPRPETAPAVRHEPVPSVNPPSHPIIAAEPLLPSTRIEVSQASQSHASSRPAGESDNSCVANQPDNHAASPPESGVSGDAAVKPTHHRACGLNTNSPDNNANQKPQKPVRAQSVITVAVLALLVIMGLALIGRNAIRSV
jgi:hypothetical protein